MDETMSDRDHAGRSAGAKRDGADAERAGEHRTTVDAESKRLREAEATQAEHPEMIGGRGRATGEPPLHATDEDADPRDPTT